MLKASNIFDTNKTKGKLIVIDGGDGSGKTIQTKLLVTFFRQKGILTKLYDFPQYHTFHGKTVARFLRGEFGEFDEVSPYLASLAFALDRASVKKEMEDFLKKGGFIITNRYTTSNMAHQSAKFKNKNDQEAYLKWICELEYHIHKIPKEDLVIFLYVPWQISQKLTEKKGERDYLKGKGLDVAEKNLGHRVSAEKMYLALAKRYKHWVKINCVKNDQMLPKEVIHRQIVKIVKKFLKI